MRQHVYFGLALVLPLVLLVSAFTFRHQPLSPEQRIGMKCPGHTLRQINATL
jgi:hypothetical protein